jgi:hypothetical protein
VTDDEMMQLSRLAGEALARKYPYVIEAEDARQDAAEWMLTHTERVERARLDNGHLYIPQVIAEILKALTPGAKQAKAKALGVSTRYQSTYTREQVEVILASVWAEADEHPVIVQENETGITAKTDAAYGGNFPVQVLDVKRAMDRVCDKREQRVLFVRYMMGETGRAAAYHSGVSRHDFESVAYAAVGKIVDELNDDMANWGGLGSRKVMSNAAAQAALETNYGGR